MTTERARGAFLAQFLAPRSAAHLDSNWAVLVGSPLRNFLDKCVERGLLQQPTLSEKLVALFSGGQLASLAREYGVPHSGTKVKVASRLVAASQDAMRALVANEHVFVVSETGRVEAEAFENAEAERRQKAEATVLSLLKERDFAAAATAAYKYEEASIFPRGVGIDWAQQQSAEDERRLAIIFGPLPPVCREFAPSVSEGLQIAAGLMLLWGENYQPTWTQLLGLESVGPDVDVQARMILFAARHRAALDGIRLSEIDLGPEFEYLVKVHPTQDARTCPTCRSYEGQTFSVSKAPVLPHAGCTSEMGCRCVYTFAVVRAK